MGTTDTGWRLAAFALAWLAGVALHLHERELFPLALHGVALVAGVSGLALAWRWRRAFVAGLAGSALLGFGLAGWQAHGRMAQALAPELEGQDIVVSGVVASLPQRSDAGLRFRFEPEQASLRGQAVTLPPRLALGWYAGFHEDAVPDAAQAGFGAGQRWRFTLRLRRPHGNLNPHGFDYELYLFEQGVRATGYVRDAPAQRLADADGFVLERWRQRVRDAIEAQVPETRAAGVLAALAVGDQGAIERADWDLFRNTGVAHLMSISGLHVTMFAWLAGATIAALWRRSPRAMLAWPAPAAARWGGLLAATLYALFSGWGVPSQRTVWMLATVTLLHGLGLRWPWPLVLLAAALVVTALDPWALLQPGFWLSFAAVGLLMASAPAQRQHDAAGDPVPAWRGAVRRVGRASRDGLRTQAVATVGLAPLTLLFFQQVSLVGFPANLVAIPVVTLLITPLALLGAVFAPVWALAAWGVQQVCAVLGLLAAMQGAAWSVPVAPWWAQAAGLLAAVLIVLPLPWRARLLALPLAVPLLVPPRAVPAEGQFELLALDVGQGTSLLVRTREHLLVYDAGPQYSRDSDAGQRVLLPVLRARGESRVHALVLSHRDTDHVGGARALLAAMPVDEVASSLEPWHPLLAGTRPRRRCTSGQSWTWDGVSFEMLRPVDGDFERGLKPNGLTCVLRVRSADRAHSALLAGDIEHDQEAALVARHGEALRSDVLIVPHHGSRSSSTPSFIDAVKPRWAVIQAGYRNRFGHPVPEVVQRYREAGVALRTSTACGAWTWSSQAPQPGPDSAVECERALNRRYWHATHRDGES